MIGDTHIRKNYERKEKKRVFKKDNNNKKTKRTEH